MLDIHRAAVANHPDTFALEIILMVPLRRMPDSPLKRVPTLNLRGIHGPREAANRKDDGLSLSLDLRASDAVLQNDAVLLQIRVPDSTLVYDVELRVRLETVFMEEPLPVGLQCRLPHVVGGPPWIQLRGETVPMGTDI